ncbi:cytoplasmic polyadenylation element-binding protein 3 isoform X7 [Cynoglossus semilaevis]|uniref:cytoplasmic polyadenylation element-binding protein 3 isoform X7 n=1 Tax=Cynoglossus semilaevis TaxID=244447 RepID=UPI000D625635|nr:cytoplasmic polyadenylation element-binding protein 3 isoform X7 [Cynoglossus semilaevis]
MSETCCFHMLRDSSLSCAQRALLQSNVHPVLLQHKWKGAVMSWRARLVIVYQSRAETVEILGKNGSMRHKHGCAFPQCSCLLVFLFIFAACANHREASTCQNRPSARRLQSGFSVSCTTSSKWQRRLFRSEHLGRMGLNFHHPGADHIMPLNSRSCLFPFEDGFLDDGHGDPSLTPGLNSPTRCQNGERMERYSRKVFVGGLPPDIDEDEITNSFRRYGHLVVDWPHKAESKSYFPPKGYAFLLFQEETSVQALIDACIEEDGKLYLCVSSPTIKDKPVQIRPWNLSDSDFVMDGSQPLDPRKTIFVGGVPRPLRAVELAMIMDRLYGGVCYAGIDTDPELKYPKGAGRVAFSNQQSYIAAISARFVQLQHNDIDKRVEVKPYVLDDQMCDECQGARCGGKFAPFFCANVTCLQYYCEYCWASIHSRAGREFHKPLVKEGGDRPRHVSFRWS